MSGTKRISALTAHASTSVAGEDILAIVDMSQASVTDKTKHITVDSLLGGANTDAKVSFKTVALLLADTTRIGYSGARFNVATGDIVTAGRYRYEVAASGASDQHVSTAGGVKLYVLPGERGYHIEAFNADLTGTNSANAILAIADAAAVADSERLFIAGGTLRITANLTLSADITVGKGGGFSTDSGVVLTINGNFQSTRQRVFNGTLSASVGPTFGPGAVDAIYPEWFGATTTGPSDTPVDSYDGIFQAMNTASRGTGGFTYKVSLAQGVYHLATGIDIPGGGAFNLEGKGISTQIRGMDAGSGYPDYLLKFVTSTTDSRISGIYFYGGSSRNINFGVYSAEMKHTMIRDCWFSNFDIAAIASSEWDNTFRDLEISFCHVGIWLRRSGGNNNDITIDNVKFVSCEVSVAANAGTSVRVENCQFQASIVAPWTKTFIYAQGISGLTINNNYFETQLAGGLAGMTFTSPETVTIYASIIFNNSDYFSDEVGTVTATLAQTSAASGSIGTISDNLFNTPSFYNAGAGGSGYTAGAVTFTALTGQGTGASGTVAVSSGVVSSATASTGGTGFQVGDIVTIVQSANETAFATVTGTTTNNAISSLIVGGAAAIYPGHVRSLTVSNNLMPATGFNFAIYPDETYCDPRRIKCSQNTRGVSDDQGILILPSYTATQSFDLSNFSDDNGSFLKDRALTRGNFNYWPETLSFAATTASLLRNATPYRNMASFRVTLLAAQQTSDAVTGSFTISSSGGSNSELAGSRVYLSVGKSESTTNVKVRLTLAITSGSNTVTVQNYDTSTSFSKSSSASRETVSINIPPTGGTLTWTIEVIAASAATQYADIFGPILTVVGNAVDEIPAKPIQVYRGSTTYDPAFMADGANDSTTVTCIGARSGDMTRASFNGSSPGAIVHSYVSATNVITVIWQNETGGSLNPGSGTLYVSAEAPV